MLCRFTESLARSVRPVTIKVYLSAVRNLHLELGYADPTVDANLLKRVIKSIGRSHGTAVENPRLPITLPLLRRLIDTSRSCLSLSQHDKLCLQAAMLTIFFGFFRCGELLDGQAARSHAEFTSGVLRIYLPRSKTDPLAKGHTVEIAPGIPPYCAVRAMLAYLAASAHCNRSPALFTLSNGSPLTRSVLTMHVRTLLSLSGVHNWKDFAGHSFQIGAATIAAVAGVPDHLIRAAGRWRSDACLRYIGLPSNSARLLADRLSSVSEQDF